MTDQVTHNQASKRAGVPSLYLLLGSGMVAGIVMAVLSIGSFGKATTTAQLPTPIPDRVRIGSPAPDFNAMTSTGDPVSLQDYRGSIIALNFWATWCAPCRVEMPVLQEAAQKFADGRLVILAVNAGENRATVQAFMDELGLSFTAVMDEDFAVVDLYGVRVFPTTIWIDEDGLVQAEHFGPLSRDQIDQYVGKLMTP